MATQAQVRRFGAGTKVYQFPDQMTMWRSNFAQLAPQSDRLPGLDGGFDTYGFSPAPSVVGEVMINFWLLADNQETMAGLKDSLRAIAGWGKQPLYMQPYDFALAERYCNARVRDIQFTEDADMGTNLSQEVRIFFEVPEARWYVYTVGGFSLWDADASIWGNASTIWGGTAATAFAGPGPLDFNLSNSGNAPSSPIIKITCTAGQSVVNPKIERIENGLVKESILFNGTIAANQVLIIDCQRLQAKLNSTDVYDNLVILKANWLSIQPGTNLVRLTSNSAADAGGVKIQYAEAFY